MKDKAFILDFNLLAEQNLSIDEYITLIYLSNNILHNISENILNSLQNKQFIKAITNEEIIIREKGKIFLELISIDGLNSNENSKKIKKSSRIIDNEIDLFIKEYRQLWKGLKLGSMGSESACKEKLARWMKNNPTYSKEDILKAAKLYLDNINNYTYLQQADYFIYKKDANGESSKLSAFIEEIDSPLNDWTSQII